MISSNHNPLQIADNDFPSDEEQVKRDIGNLKSELLQAIDSFIKGDPLIQIENLKDDLEIPKSVGNLQKMLP